jgi:hypothetical protein
LEEGLLPPGEAARRELTPEAAAHVQQYTSGCIDGDPEEVREGILRAAKSYGTTDVGIVTIAYALEDRIRSYELVARAFGLI